MKDGDLLQTIITKNILDKINKRYYAFIPKTVDFEHIVKTPNFSNEVTKNVALYSDHGLNHVLNVATEIPVILRTISDVHLPKRSEKRSEFMIRYGTILGLIHDIGMSDTTSFGREMHGEFVAQEVFRSNFTPIFNTMWEENIGNIPWTLLYMQNQGILKEPAKTVFREMLSLAVCHRKVLVPVKILNDPKLLREQMQFFVTKSLHYQHLKNAVQSAETQVEIAKKNKDLKLQKYITSLQLAKQNLENAKPAEISNADLLQDLKRHYSDFANDSFKWLLSENKEIISFISDVIDTLRILRCSDALRLRGTDLKTSAQYQIFVSQFTASAIYALTNKEEKMYLLEIDDAISSGEANLASVILTKEGNLRFEFHRGLFHSGDAEERGATYLARLVAQLKHDIFNTFVRPKSDIHNFKPLSNPKLLLERTDDFPKFTTLVAKKTIKLDPNLKETVKIVPSLKNISQVEYQHYLNALEINWSNKEKLSFLRKIAEQGFKTEHLDIDKAFQHARITEIKPKEALFEAKGFSGLVYFPFSYGLMGTPSGSYDNFIVAPFTPLGNTGVIRGDIRNATIVARKSVKLLIIPKDIYLNYWHATYSVEEFANLIKKKMV